jgi:HlyD family secretion protein
LPDIRDQLARLRGNLAIVRAKLDNLIVRAPIAGRVTAIDLKVGESRGPGQRLAEIVADTGFKLTASIDEFYLNRVRKGLNAQVDLTEAPAPVAVTRVDQQVRDGRFNIDLTFTAAPPPGLRPGQTLQGRLALGDDTPALILPAGAFLEQTGGGWVFVMDDGGVAANRRVIKLGRRNAEQLEVLGGLAPGERAITSAYGDLDRIDRIVLTP